MAYDPHPDITEVILSREDIREIVHHLGHAISNDYRDKNPLIVTVLRGAFVFAADLVRSITIPCTVDFMAVSSYGNSTKSSGRVRIVKDLDTSVEGRHIIFAEDILDSGLTLSYLMKLFEGRGAASISICAFAVKDVADRKPAVEPTYVGTHVPDKFIVGYGLDYAERYRNLPFVGVLKPEVYS